MKFASYAAGDGGVQLGWIDEAAGVIRPIAAATEMVDLITHYDEIKLRLPEHDAALPLASVRLLAPSPLSTC
jgi:hypothetical protein